MTPEFFSRNRQTLVEQLQGGIVVLSGYTSMQRGGDMAFLFEQEANFWWLTGVEFPDWWLIIDGTRKKSWLVAPKVSTIHHVFDGSLSEEEARQSSGVDGIISEDEAHSMLRSLAKKHSVAYTLGELPYAEHMDFHFNPGPKKATALLERTFASVQDCRKDLAKLRAIKQPEEITAIKKAVALTVEAFEKVKANFSTYRFEYEIEADFSYHFRWNGGAGHAYDPIVASGEDTCTLHYMKNNNRLKKRQLVLMDIGARYEGYAADVTRTLAFGEPTNRQRALHEAVQNAHEKIVALIKPQLSVEEYQRNVDAIMKDALMSLGLLKNRQDNEMYHTYFPHAISHGLGVDVHDSLGAPKFLQPGMVLTVEPGIYIPEEGIGVRIEDDILVTEKGCSNLSGRLSTDL